eukprot:4030366-Lingulodinium_polyedra.AAC.1
MPRGLGCLNLDSELPRELFNAAQRAAAPTRDPGRDVSGSARRPHAVHHGQEPYGPALHGVEPVSPGLGEQQPLLLLLLLLLLGTPRHTSFLSSHSHGFMPTTKPPV